jgi:hypothetical protein
MPTLCCDLHLSTMLPESATRYEDGGLTNMTNPWAIYNMIKASYEESWEIFSEHGKPKPPNAYLVFKSFYKYSPLEAARLWNALPKREKHIWQQVAGYLNQDHRIKFPDHGQEEIRAQGTNSRRSTTALHQYHQESESSISPRIRTGTVPSVQHTSYPVVDGYPLNVSHQITHTEDQRDGQEPQQYCSSWQAGTILPRMQGLRFPAEHVESSPSLNSLYYSGRFLSESQHMDFPSGLPAEPSHTFDTVDAEAEWLDTFVRL